jgi:nicotinate-nucleotide adenylyltransferase
MLRLGILGGSFNPVHVAHVRLAVEMAEALNLDRVELIPAARPPHKSGEGMLPFELRAELLSLAIQDIDSLRVNLMEAERPGPSYTWDTLKELAARNPKADIHFIMGASDLLNLHLWRNGTELGSLANLAVATRDHLGREEVESYLSARPEIRCEPDGPDRWRMDSGKSIELVDIPRLDISASFVRERFRRGANLRFLIPREVEEQLNRQRDQILKIWS